MRTDDCLHILLVEDNEDDYVIVRDLLRDIDSQKFTLEWASSYEDGLTAVQAVCHDLILMDFRLSYHTGLELLQETQMVSRRAPVIFMTGQGDYETDVQAMQSGAADYLVKDRLDADTLERAIRYAVERQKSAEALRAGEERYRTFIKNSTEGIWRFELEPPLSTAWPEKEQLAHLCRYGKVAECNDAVAHLYGYSCAEDVLGVSFGELLSLDTLGHSEYLSAFARSQYESASFEAFAIDRQGRSKCILHTLAGVVENKFLHRIWGTLGDITERKRAETAQADLAAIVASSDASIVSYTLDGTVVTWNKGAEAIYGYAASEIIGQPIDLMVPSDRKEELHSLLSAIRHGRSVPTFETTRICKDSACIDVSLSISPIVNARGEVTGGSAVSHDISARKAAEKGLQASEANMAVAQRLAHFGSWELELGDRQQINANPLRWSDETFRIFGYAPGSVAVTNDLFFQAVPEEDRLVIEQAVAAAVAGQQSYSFVHRILRPNGEERIVHEIAELLEADECGQPPKLIGTVHDITDQRRAEEHIRFQGLLLSQVRNAVIATDLAGQIVYWNSFAETLYQWKAEEVVGRNIADVTVLREGQTAAEDVMREIRETGHWQGEWLVQRKDGSSFTASVENTLFSDADGNVVGVVGVSVDISERKRAEASALKNQQEQRDLAAQLEIEKARLVAAQAVAKVGSWETDLATMTVTWSAESYRIFEITPNGMPLTHQRFLEAVHPEDRAGVDDALTQSLAQTGDSIVVHRLLLPDGRIKFVEERWHVFHDAAGKPVRALGTCQDITERRHAEEAVRENEEKFRTIVETTLEGVMMVDANSRISYVNQRICDIFGYSAHELIGRDRFFLVDDEDRAKAKQNAQRRRQGVQEQFDRRFRHKDGALVWGIVSATPLSNKDGQIVGSFLMITDITKRKRVEEERDRFFTMSLDMVCIAGIDGYFKRLNPAWEATLGHPQAELLAKPFLELVHPDDREITLAQTELLSRGATVTSFENRYRCRDGSYKWISWRCAPDPLTGSIYAVARDTTQRKLNEQNLALRDQAIRASSNGIVVTDMRLPDQPLVYVNPAFEKMTGYTASEVLGKNCRFLQGPDTDQSQVDLVRAALEKGEPVTVMLRNYRKNGTAFWNELSLNPIRDVQGTLTHYVGIQNDVTDRRHSEDALRVSEQRLRMVVSNLPVIIWALDENAVFTFSEGQGLDALGLKPAQVVGHSALDIYQDNPTVVAYLHDALRGTRDYWVAEVAGMLFETHVTPIRDEHGKIRGIIGLAQDITDRKRAEDEITRHREELIQTQAELETRVQSRTMALQNAVEEAERANAAKSDFLSRMSHELRTPMNSILGFAQVMEMDEPSEKQTVRLGHIIRSGQHLLQLINEVLDTALVESGRLQVSSEPVSVHGILRMATEMIQPLCAPRDQRIVYDWAEWEPHYVKADQQRLSQVMINLLSNATKFNRDGGVILVQCQQHTEGRLRISISDSGAGIPADQIEKLFQPFERLGAESGPIEGTGLGLALSKRLVELMDGTIEVRSVVGVGSTFCVELPLADCPVRAIIEPPTRSFPADVRFSRHSILYIEDNDANLQVISHILSSQPQYQLTSAQDGLTGLRMAQSESPSLILLDMHLPDLPGAEVLSRLQNDPFTRDIPVVVVSADATPGQIRRLLTAGAAEYLTKPLDVRRFLDVLEKTLSQKETVHG